MGSLIHYSGISTKIRAMERWRIKPEQFEQMAALESVPEAVRFLRSLPPYEKIFSGVEDKELHRGRIEQLLNLAQYEDFASLYQFANMKQRRFLDLYFMHYEIGIVKTCLRNAAATFPSLISAENALYFSFTSSNTGRQTGSRSIPSRET